MENRWRLWIAFLFLSVLVACAILAGLAWSPTVRKARHLERGDRYFSGQQFREAIPEYRNVLQIEGTNPHAIRRLGLAHYQLNEFGHAFRYLPKVEQLEPDDLDVRLKLGTIYLLGRRREEARKEAAFVLQRDPTNIDALTLLAGAAITPQEVDDAVRRLEGARADLADRARLHLALGTLYLRKRDPGGAERAWKEAVAAEPTSIEAHMVLGDFYLLKRDLSLAEREYKVAAELAPIASLARIKLADFYLVTRRPEEAKRVLAEMTAKAPDYLPAWRRIAEVAVVEGKYDETTRALELILKKNPSDLEGHLLRGRVYLARQQTTEAIEEFRRVLKLEPRLTGARYQLALAQLQAGNPQYARAELREATTLDPTFTEGILTLAELDIEARAFQPAIDALEKLAGRQPTEARTHALLGSAYLAKGDPARAMDAFRRFRAQAPKDPRGPYFLGLGFRAQGKTTEAKQQFEASLDLAPEFLEPLAQLVALALAEKNPDAALMRVRQQIARAPKSAPLHHLLGGVHLARRETEQAEASYLKALELNPNLSATYVALGQLYFASGKYSQALARLSEGLKVNPKDLVAHMLSGVIYERLGDIPRARQAYERALEVNPRFAPAANNLAYIHSEHGGDKDKALQLAQTAKQVAPNDPSISDTLGWILYKRGVYHRAVGLLKESAAKLPENPEVQYHVGMASWKVGDKEGARKALALATNSPRSFAGKDDAKRVLAELQ